MEPLFEREGFLAFKDDVERIKSLILVATKEAVSVKNMHNIAQAAANDIKLRTRLGSGVSEAGGKKEPLAKLAPSTIASRKSKKRTGKLSSLTTPGKSNLTDTGQMLDSLTGKGVSDGIGRISLAGTRRDGQTNTKVGEYAEDGSSTRPKRPFLNLTDLQFKRIQDDLRLDVVARVKKALTK